MLLCSYTNFISKFTKDKDSAKRQKKAERNSKNPTWEPQSRILSKSNLEKQSI